MKASFHPTSHQLSISDYSLGSISKWNCTCI